MTEPTADAVAEEIEARNSPTLAEAVGGRALPVGTEDAEADLARILAAGMKPEGQPVWTRLFSAERIRDLASQAPSDGPLSGVLFAVKDNLDVAGEPTGAAFPPLAAAAPAQRTATAVQRLQSAGAVPVGKANLDQFATGLVGARSPYGACHAVGHPSYVSGGSSSGSAVAVALGLVPLALGTDTAGSGRVPAAFNGLVGLKPTRGLVSTSGLLPACRSLDCVTTFTRTVATARAALAVLAAPDPQDPYSRSRPPYQPAIAVEPRVIAVPDPSVGLDLDPAHRAAWESALAHAHKVAEQVVTFDPAPFLEAAALLYQGPWIAERWHAIAPLLGADGLEHPDLDPAVRAVLRGAGEVSGADVFAGLDRLAALRRATEGLWWRADAMLLPVTAGHPSHAELAADPVGVNARLGTYTNFVNLLDLCAIAVPAGSRTDGLPFGVQLIAPAFHDEALLDLAAQWVGEEVDVPVVPAGETLLAVAGAHLSGLPLNGQLLALGARLRYRTRTAPGYRLYRLPGGSVARPGLARTGDGPEAGIALEVWQLDHRAVGALLDTVPAPLGFGRVALTGGDSVLGFLAQGPVPDGAQDVTAYGGWREYLAAQ
jgi:allophanate hydrolase